MNAVNPRKQAGELLAAGRTAEARALYARACAEGSTDPEIWDALGQIEAMAGDWPSAEARLRRAVELDPSYVPGHCNLGVVLQERGDHAGAAGCYERALALKPDDPALCYNLGSIRAARGDDAGARELYERALALDPAAADPRLALGALHEKENHPKLARGCYEQVLERAPGHPKAHFGLGNLELAARRLTEAETHYRTSLKADPRQPEAWNNLAKVLVDAGRFDEAAESYRRVLALNPRHTGAHNNLGNVLVALGRTVEAIGCFEQALALQPDYSDAWNNLGLARADSEDFAEAERCYREAIRINSGLAAVWNNLGRLLRDQGRAGEGIDMLYEALRLNPKYSEAHSNLLFSLNYTLNDPERLFAEHRQWGERHGQPREEVSAPLATPLAGRKLRVGYVSGDFRGHSVAYFMEPVLKAHDRERFEVYCYSELARGKHDATTGRIRALADEWRDTMGLNDRELAQRIRADGIDILVDLAGHTAHNRLLAFARRPAPVQASWIGYCNTTGLPSMDYRLTDQWADPPGHERFHTEELVRLPGGFLCYGPPENAPAVVAVPARAAGHLTFGSFNNPAKLSEQTIALWARLLAAVPGSRLVLKGKLLKDPATCERLAARFATHGIPRSRLEFIGWLAKRDDHLGLYGQIDIALDTFPYNGTTTTCEALWMGVPVMALEGNRHAARVGVSILSNLDLTELIAKDEEDYIEKARTLAADPERLKTLRTTMRDRMERSTLCDPGRFTRELEQVYLGLWERAADGSRGGRKGE